MAEDAQIVAMLAGVLAGIVAVLLVLVRTFQEARAANKAVNNVAPGTAPLSQQVIELGVIAHEISKDVAELVEAQRDFSKRGWATLPDDIGTAARLTETIRHLQSNDSRLEEKLDVLTETIIDHDRWERSQKYDSA